MKNAFIFILALSVYSSAFAEFTLVANHPEARAWYPSLEYEGRGIRVLRAYKGRVYMGFGRDDGPPVGGSYIPLNIRYIDQNDQLSSVQGALRSQEMSIMEVMNGALFIPSEDWEGDDYSKCSSTGCISNSFAPAERSHHVYAAAEYNGNIYMVGSSGEANCTATVWKSIDDGNSWSVDRVMSKDNNYFGCARFAFVGVTAGKLFVQGYQYDWSAAGEEPCAVGQDESSTCNWRVRPEVHVLNGEVWSVSTSNPILTSNLGSRVVHFAGKMLFTSSWWDDLSSYNGTTKKHIRDDVKKFTMSGGWFYVLTNSQKVLRTKNLVNWFNVDQAPSNAISIEVENNAVYVGTTNGQVFKSPISEPPDIQFIKYKKYLIPISSK